MNQVSEEDAAMFATSLWCIWYWRNQLQYSDKITIVEKFGMMVEVQSVDYLHSIQARRPQKSCKRVVMSCTIVGCVETALRCIDTGE